MSDYKLIMKFDMNTIQHLGISMYSRLPPVIAELVANAYDADATKVNIFFYDRNGEKYIVVQDNGHGMTLEEINEKLLVIGRNRRINSETSESGRRKDIKKCQSQIYHPKQIIINEDATENSGTIVELRQLKRKSKFDLQGIAEDLSKRFLIFGNDFKVQIIFNDDYENVIHVTNELRFAKISKEFTFKFPNEDLRTDYVNKNKVIGEVYIATKPIPSSLKGIYLVARGKLVQSNSFFGARADDYIHSYITGYLQVDFIDEDVNTDLIATNRETLTWVSELTEELYEFLQEIVNYVAREGKKKRQEKKEETLETEYKIPVKTWVESLPIQEKKVAKKMTNLVMSDANMDLNTTAELVTYIKKSIEHESFKEFACLLEGVKDLTALEIIKMFKDWEIVEAKELYNLALVRVETIKKFEENILSNIREKPELHNFLKTFPWLLDPRIMKLEDEVTYSNLLRNNFKESDTVPETDRRIDFLCVDLASIIFIIELKRPNIKANGKILDQALEYASFLRSKKGNDPDFSKRDIKTFIVCDGIVNKPEVKEKADAYEMSGKVYVRTYTELLANARKYHEDFINRYEKITR